MTLAELHQQIREYVNKGYYHDVAEAVRDAQLATRDFVARTYPKTAFSGKHLGGKQIIVGKYDVQAERIQTTVYANYFSRWYNTGAFGRVIRYGKRRGERGPIYPSRGSYFESNRAAIDEFFARRLEDYLQKHIKL